MTARTTSALDPALQNYKYWDNNQARTFFEDVIDSGLSGVDNTANVQELTATGTVSVTTRVLELNHATVIVAATLAQAPVSQMFIVKDTSASGTAAHTLTLTAGTFNGTNNVATLDAPNEALVVYFDSAGNGTIVENVGTVALS